DVRVRHGLAKPLVVHAQSADIRGSRRVRKGEADGRHAALLPRDGDLFSDRRMAVDPAGNGLRPLPRYPAGRREYPAGFDAGDPGAVVFQPAGPGFEMDPELELAAPLREHRASTADGTGPGDAQLDTHGRCVRRGVGGDGPYLRPLPPADSLLAVRF